MKIVKIICIFFVLSLASCYSDKGNYEYGNFETLTFENIAESYNIIGGAEPLIVTPKITSSVHGLIASEDLNYEYSYWINVSNRETNSHWTLIYEGSQAVNQLITAPTGAHQLWIKAHDKRTGVTHSGMSKLVVSSTTYEGWMLFGTEGVTRRSRLDMISYVSATRQIPVYDLMVSRGLPEETTGAYGIGFWANFSVGTMDRMYLMTDQGAYRLERNEFTTSDKETINFIDFISPKTTAIPVTYGYSNAKLLVSKDGDVYAQYSRVFGEKFTYPINTTVRGSVPEFKVAPFLGYNAKRPSINSRLFVLYDITNKRFMGWDDTVQDGGVLFPLLNPGMNSKFDYNIGMEMLHMEGTAFDDGVALAVLKDSDGDINVVGIKVSAKNFEQHSYYSKINAPNIKNATKFAFHSMFPLMFYAVGGDIYCYNLGTGTSNLALSKQGEEITCLKFNLFKNGLSGNGKLNKTDDEFMSLQYKLVVCSYKNGEPKNGGAFGLYKVIAPANSLTQDVEYNGFCRIADVLYRERRERGN